MKKTKKAVATAPKALRRARGDAGRLDIRAVAREANVSSATVSRTINAHPTVDAKLKARVWAAIEKLGYVPNTQARALVSGQSKLLGVIISDITNPFFPELVQGFEDAAVAVGYETLIGSTNYNLDRMNACVQRMIQRKVDGVAVMTFGIEEPLLDRLTTQGIPMVFIDVAPKVGQGSAIVVDYDSGISEAVQHLAVLGHRRIAFIAGPGTLHSATARRRAFREAADAIGLTVPDTYIEAGQHTVEGGQRAAEALLSLPTPPTAILCSNDVSAIGALHAISRAGLTVPTDISIIGFDDVRFCQYLLPPLTTVRMSGAEIAARAVKTLMGKLDPSRPADTSPIETRLIVRKSTAIPRGALHDLSPRSKASRKQTR